VGPYTCTQKWIDTDKNSDGTFSISDVWSVLNDVLTLPYRMLHDAVEGNDFYNFFEMTPYSCYESTAQIFGAILAVLMVIGSTSRSP
jgi:hypothetical protein